MHKDLSPHHPLLDRLHLLSHRVKLRLHEASRDGGREGAEGLAPVEARVLAYFARHPGSTQRELVQHSGRDKAQIGRIVKLLQERGLLQAEADPADGRSVLLSPTDTGRTLQRRLHQQRVRIEGELMQRLSAAQQKQLLGCLDVLLGEGP